VNILILQLSDMHIEAKAAQSWSAKSAKLIARSAARGGPYSHVILIISGDIAYSASKDEYKLAELFISEIVAELKSIATCEIKVVLAPGNHDCDFSAPSRLREFARSQRTPEALADPEILQKLSEPLSNFQAFASKAEDVSYTTVSATEKSLSFAVAETKLQIRVFNSPLFSVLKEKKGELYLPEHIFERDWAPDAFRIAVMHHPAPWFSDPASRSIRRSLREHAHMILFGHEHEPELSELTTHASGQRNEAIEVDGPVLHAHGQVGLGNFITFEIDPSNSAVAAMLHSLNADGEAFAAQTLTGLSREANWLTIPRKSKPFQLGEKFIEKIEDPGLVISAKSGRRVTLVDLYVQPEFSVKLNGPHGTEEIWSADRLVDPRELAGGLVIQGDEKAGKTSLLFRLFSLYYEVGGAIPIYLPLRQSKIKHPKDFDAILKRAIEDEYPGENEDSFAAIPKSRKVFFVDDIDVLQKPELRSALVDFLNSHCEVFVATTTLRTQLTEVLTGDSTAAVSSIRHLRWVKFSFQKRAALIGNWVRVLEGVDDEEQFIARVDFLEKSANATLGHNLVPRVPQMLLIFLQSTAATSTAKLESGALAHYYSYLVTSQLLTAGVPPEEIDEYVSFSRIVAFQMHTSGRDYVSLIELDQCNTQFNEEFYPGLMQSRLNVLKNARLLTEYGSDAFQWRHSYFYYLFLGGYLGVNGDKQEVADAVKEMCKHLYVRANANALLFLVHFSKDRKIFATLKDVVSRLFESSAPLKLGKDTKDFTEVIRDAKSLIIPESVKEERDRVSREKDRADERGGDGLQESRKPVGTTLEDLIVLFKTSEILGQVLKEQYASIPRAVREPIVVALLDGYMRAAGGILREIALQRPLLQKWLLSKLGSNTKLTDAEKVIEAQSLIAELVQMFMFAFFHKLAEGISSDKTLDLIRNIKWPDELEPKVFLLSCELNLQRPPPFGTIDSLLDAAGNDQAFIALIRNLVQVRVSLFHTRTPDLQALSKRFNFDLSRLKAIDYRESRNR
jgi:GTPase SAR1 family protein